MNQMILLPILVAHLESRGYARKQIDTMLLMPHAPVLRLANLMASRMEETQRQLTKDEAFDIARKDMEVLGFDNQAVAMTLDIEGDGILKLAGVLWEKINPARDKVEQTAAQEVTDEVDVNYVVTVTDEDGYINLFFNDRHIDSFSPGTDHPEEKKRLMELAADLAGAHNTAAQHFTLSNAAVKEIFGDVAEPKMYDADRIFDYLRRLPSDGLKPIVTRPMSRKQVIEHYLSDCGGDIFYDAARYNDHRASLQIEKVKGAISDGVLLLNEQDSALKKAEQIIANLSGALESCMGQIEQMKGMFDDSDGAIQASLDDADEAMAEAAKLQRRGDMQHVKQKPGADDCSSAPRMRG